MSWTDFWIGVVTGLIASVLFCIINYFVIRPRIKVAPKIRKYTNEGKTAVSIKIVNVSLCRLLNLKYNLSKVIVYADGNSESHKIEANKTDNVTDLVGFNLKNTDYALRISFNLPEDTFTKPSDASDVKLVFSVQAMHSISGTISIKSRDYHKEDLIEGFYGTGLNMKISQR